MEESGSAQQFDEGMASSNQPDSIEESNTNTILEEDLVDTTIDTDMVHLEDIEDVSLEDENINATMDPNNQDQGDGGAPGRKPRTLRSQIWKVFIKLENDTGEVTGVKCRHCKRIYSWQKTGTRSHLGRHIKSCNLVLEAKRSQAHLNYQPTASRVSGNSIVFADVVDGKYEPMKMREAIAHWILMHEHPFSLVDEEGFNLMMSVAIPQWGKISCLTCKNDCMKVYDHEKEKVRSMLSKVEKISLATDLWKSKSQKIGYMVVTAHFLDSDWKRNKWVLSFVHIPLPYNGENIANALFKCMTEWGIEKKVYTVSVDNASANDSAIKALKQIIERNRKLICGGKLFHVRCTAHILNQIAQDGVIEIKSVIKDIRESIAFINHSEARLKAFSEIVKQLNLHTRKLLLDREKCWNSTYEMLACACTLRDAFLMFQRQDLHYCSCPTIEEWEKVSKTIELLEVFSNVTNLISRSDYPMTNLFLCEVHLVKQALDLRASSTDAFIKNMVLEMKKKFDKYWGECNLLMALATIFDPRLKMKAVDYFFRQIYPESQVEENKEYVKSALHELFREYAAIYKSQNEGTSSHSSMNTVSSNTGFMKLMRYVREMEIKKSVETDLELYLEDRYLISADYSDMFDILQWWKENQSKYRVLSKMACDILAIPISTVASETTYSAGFRVIDAYRASLSIETVQALICGGDWLRNSHGVKKKNQVVQPVEIKLLI